MAKSGHQRKRRTTAPPPPAPPMSNRERTRAARTGGPHTAVPAQRTNSRQTILIAAGVAAVVVVAAVVIGVLARGGDDPKTVSTNTSLAPVEGRVKGSASAPVTIIEYSDLQCPNCASFALGTEKEIEKRYIETGKVKLEARNFAFLGKESERAALANECAGEQGKYWQYRDVLYANQKGENRGGFSDANLKRLAATVGMDGETLGACMDSGRYDERVKQDRLAGQASGVQGTPSFLINGQLIVGNQPPAAFYAAIEQALAGR